VFLCERLIISLYYLLYIYSIIITINILVSKKKEKERRRMFMMKAVVVLMGTVMASAIDSKKALAYTYNSTHPSVGALGKSVSSNGWVSYKQCDPTWASQQLGYCSLTICDAGCAMRY
jgi:hypothetical protein